MKGCSQGSVSEGTTVGTSAADGRGHLREGDSRTRDSISISDRVLIGHGASRGGRGQLPTWA